MVAYLAHCAICWLIKKNAQLIAWRFFAFPCSSKEKNSSCFIVSLALLKIFTWWVVKLQVSSCLPFKKVTKQKYYCNANVFALTCGARSFIPCDLKFMLRRDNQSQSKVIVHHFL